MNFITLAVGIILVFLVLKFIGKIAIKILLTLIIVAAVIYFFKHPL